MIYTANISFPSIQRYAAYSITIPFFLSAFFFICSVEFFFSSMVETAHNHWWRFHVCVACFSNIFVLLFDFFFLTMLQQLEIYWLFQTLEGLQSNYFSHFSIGCHSFIYFLNNADLAFETDANEILAWLWTCNCSHVFREMDHWEWGRRE